MQMKFIFLFVLLVTICFCVNAQVKNQVTNTQTIVGTWVSTRDKNSQTIFTKTEELDYYGIHLMSRFTYEIKRDTLVAVNQKNGEIYRYLITSLTKDDLILKFIRTGYVIEYRRKRD